MRRLTLSMLFLLTACSSLLGIEDGPDTPPTDDDAGAGSSSGGSSGRTESSSSGGSSGGRSSSSSGGSSGASSGGSSGGADGIPAARFVEDVGVGDMFICARTRAGRVWCWGDNTYGQLGNGTEVAAAVPTLVPDLEGVTMLTAGSHHACAVLQSGDVRCWGAGSRGQIGNDDTKEKQLTPAAVLQLTGVTAITAGNVHTCAIAAGAVHCWGHNVDGEAGQDIATVPAGIAYPAPVAGATGVIAIGSGSTSSHTCAARANGTVICWGYNGDFGLGSGPEASSASPREVPNVTDVAQICTGPSTTNVALGDGRVATWGIADSDWAENGAPEYLPPSPSYVPGLSGVTQVACSNRHGCSLGANGVVCFGNDYFGQLGRGNPPEVIEPYLPNAVSVLDNAVRVATGPVRSCATTSDGSLYCWGYNDNADLGVSVPDAKVTRPARVVGFGPE